MSLIQVSSLNNVRTYDLAGGTRRPQFVAEKGKSSKSGAHPRAGAQGSTRHIEVLQDLDFPGTCQRVRFSPDGEYFMATGCYPPQLRIYELRQLSMKVKRHVDAELVQMHILSDDYRKVALLRADRTLELHAQYGVHYKTRIPSFGRDLQYEPSTCDLIIGGAGPELWCLNLDEGRYREPILTACSGINVLARAAAHGMLAVGGEDGIIACVDPRSRSRLGLIDSSARLPAGALGGSDGAMESATAMRGVSGVTALQFDESGLVLAAGTAGGHVLLFDVRMARPLLHKDHRYGLPLRSVAFARSAADAGTAEQVVVSADAKSIRLWHRSTGAPITTIEPAADLNELSICPKSGLMIAALEQPNLGVYFVPALGAAPRWCAFLDSLTEEMEEVGDADGGALYDDYRFVARDELARLGLESLVGTNLLRAYMHGFFIDARLHAKAVDLAQPFAYEEWRQKRIQEKVEEATAGRIAPVKRAKSRAPAVNAELAAKLTTAGAAGLAGKGGRKAATGKSASALLSDTRFGGLFSDPEFAIDTDAGEYKMLHGEQNNKKGARGVVDAARAAGGSGYNKVPLSRRMAEDDEDCSDEGSEEAGEGGSDAEAQGGAAASDSDSDVESDSESEPEPGPASAGRQRPSSASGARPLGQRQLVAVDGGLLGKDVAERARMAVLPGSAGPSFERQLRQQQASGELHVSGSARGSAEMTFLPMAKRRQLEARRAQTEQRRDPSERRGVRELGLKSAQPKDYRRR